MVTGGYGSGYLDTTEVYSANVWRTVGKLPVAMTHVRAATVNNRVVLFGIIIILVVDWFLINISIYQVNSIALYLDFLCSLI